MWARPSRLDTGLAVVSAALTLVALYASGIDALTDTGLAGSRWWAAPLLLAPSVTLLWLRHQPPVTVVGAWAPLALHAQRTRDGGEGLSHVCPAWVIPYGLAS